MANTSPRHMPVLGKFTPLKSKILIFFLDVISLLARVFILLIDGYPKGSHEFFLKEIVSPVFEIRH